MGDRPDPFIANLRHLEETDPFCPTDGGVGVLNGVGPSRQGPTGLKGSAGGPSMYWNPSSPYAWCPHRSDQTYETNHVIAERDLLLMIRKKNSFANAVLRGNGKLNYSIREKEGNNDHHWKLTLSSSAADQLGHGYVTTNSLGKPPGYTTATIMSVVGKNINALFPGGVGGDDRTIKLGQSFDLKPLKTNHVQVVYVCPYFAVFQTTVHVLQGVAVHGVVQDNTGEFWMFQEGWGEPRDPTLGVLGRTKRHLLDQTLNYKVAEGMWQDFANSAKKFLQQHPAAQK